MSEDEKMILEHRLTVLEEGVRQIKENSDERLAAIMGRFDKQDRIYAWLISGAFSICLGIGAIYLEEAINKPETKYSATVISTVDERV